MGDNELLQKIEIKLWGMEADVTEMTKAILPIIKNDRANLLRQVAESEVLADENNNPLSERGAILHRNKCKAALRAYLLELADRKEK